MRKVLLLLLSVMVSAAAWCQREKKVQVTETMHQHVKNQAVAVKAMIQEQE